MRLKGALACVGLAVLAAGCDLTTDRRYVNEGAGVDLYTADRANQTELLNQYTGFICEQAGPSCGGNWATFVQAGMNDIDQRCDGFLTWLDARRRDKEPILAELSAISTAVHSIMTVTGSSPKSLDIVTAAFGLATATYNNLNSRLLISVNQSTVQEIVYKSQGQYREKIRTWPIPDKPTAIYLLRNYLRLCTPITIEASINTITTLVQRDQPEAAGQSLVVSTTKPRSGVIGRSDESIEPGITKVPRINDGIRIGIYEQTLQPPQVIRLEKYACLTPTGTFTHDLRDRIMGRLEAIGAKDQAFPDRLTARDGAMIRRDQRKGNKAC